MGVRLLCTSLMCRSILNSVVNKMQYQNAQHRNLYISYTTKTFKAHILTVEVQKITIITILEVNGQPPSDRRLKLNTR